MLLGYPGSPAKGHEAEVLAFCKKFKPRIPGHPWEWSTIKRKPRKLTPPLLAANPLFWVRVYDIPKGSLFKWMTTIEMKGPRPAGELVELVCAERGRNLVVQAIEAGLIEKVRWNPTREQQFFGVGGTTIKGADKTYHVECWSYDLTERGKRWLRGETQEEASSSGTGSQRSSLRRSGSHP